MSLLDATTNPNGNDTMGAVSPATVSGSVAVPSGYLWPQSGVGNLWRDRKHQPLPSATTYTWSVFSFGPFASVDAAAGSTGLLGGFVGTLSADVFTGRSGSRSFTTAP